MGAVGGAGEETQGRDQAKRQGSKEAWVPKEEAQGLRGFALTGKIREIDWQMWRFLQIVIHCKFRREARNGTAFDAQSPSTSRRCWREARPAKVWSSKWWYKVSIQISSLLVILDNWGLQAAPKTELKGNLTCIFPEMKMEETQKPIRCHLLYLLSCFLIILFPADNPAPHQAQEQ